jgi:hypothetical protein
MENNLLKCKDNYQLNLMILRNFLNEYIGLNIIVIIVSFANFKYK